MKLILNTVLLIGACIVLVFPVKAAEIKYTFSFPQPQTHYVEVDMQVSGWKGGALDVRMPVWTPGSYLVREFSKNVEGITAADNNGKSLQVNHVSKNGWLIPFTVSDMHIRYKVYAFELTVRTCFVDIDHAYLNPTSVCLYVYQHTDFPCVVKVEPYAAWKVMSVALDPLKSSDSWTVSATGYDELADSPFEIGNHTVLKFTAAGVPHEIALFGEGNYVADKLKTDVAKIVEEETSVFGVNPCRRYVFIVHNLAAGGGGLEHRNSTTIQTARWNYNTETGYNGFLNLMAHEYFHLWNGKRLRPLALGPFDYNNENYTTMLWFVEGFTAYYDDLIVRRCGFTSPDTYLGALAGSMGYVDNSAGNKIQSLSESSFDAWIKFYRPGENSANNTISYYTKGSVIAAMLNFSIMQSTQGKKSLDDLMKFLYTKFYIETKGVKGFTDEEFIHSVNEVTGNDMRAFFSKYVSGTDSINYDDFVNAIGMKVINMNSREKSTWLGANAAIKDGKLTVTSVERGSPAWNDGINVNDELLAVGPNRINEDLARILNAFHPGDRVKVIVSRSGFIREIPVTLGETPYVKYAFQEIKDADALSKANFKNWLKMK